MKISTAFNYIPFKWALTLFLVLGSVGAVYAANCCVRTSLDYCDLSVAVPCQTCEPCNVMQRRLVIPYCSSASTGYKTCSAQVLFDCREMIQCEPDTGDFDACGSINDIIQRRCKPMEPGNIVKTFARAADLYSGECP